MIVVISKPPRQVTPYGAATVHEAQDRTGLLQRSQAVR